MSQSWELVSAGQLNECLQNSSTVESISSLGVILDHTLDLEGMCLTGICLLNPREICKVQMLTQNWFYLDCNIKLKNNVKVRQHTVILQRCVSQEFVYWIVEKSVEDNFNTTFILSWL